MADAVKAAHEQLNLTGFVAVGGGSLEGQALYSRALELMRQGSPSSDDPGLTPKRCNLGAGVRGRALAAIIDAAGKEGRHLEMLARFSRRHVEDLSKADEHAAQAVSRAVSSERQASRGVAGALQRVVQGLLRGLLGREPSPDTAAEAVTEAACALKAGRQAAPGGAPSASSSDSSGALVAALPTAVAELLACHKALTQEIAVLRATVSREEEAAALLRKEKEAVSRELEAVRRELEAARQDLQLERTALVELQEGQAKSRDQAARRICAMVQAVVLSEMDGLSDRLDKGLAVVGGRLEGGVVSLDAAGSSLKDAEAAAQARIEALAGEAEARAEEGRGVCDRLKAAQDRAAQAASTAEAAGGRAAEGLLSAAESLRGVGDARGKAEDAQQQLDEELQRYKDGHAEALETHHSMVEEGMGRGPMSMFSEFHGPKTQPNEPLTPEKCVATPRNRGTKRWRCGSLSPAQSAGAEAGPVKPEAEGELQTVSPVTPSGSEAVSA